MRRVPSVDLLRVAVVLVIVYRHTYPVGDGVQSILLTGSVPFFFFLTGWLWRPSKRSWREEVSTRTKSLAYPYVSWLLLIAAVYAAGTAVTGSLDLSGILNGFLGGTYAGRPFSTFWFISVLFLVATLGRAIDAWPLRLQAVIGISAVCIAGFFGEQMALVPLAFGLALPCMFFMIAGRILRRLLPESGLPVSLAAVALWLLISIAAPWLGYMDIKNGEFGVPFFSALSAVAMAWASIVLLNTVLGLFPRLSNVIAPTAARLTSVSIAVVLAHPLALYLLRAPNQGAPLWAFLLAAVVPWAGALLVARSPLSTALIGTRQRSREKPLSLP